jgi:transcriptional regulator with XRE-family HTH domain
LLICQTVLPEEIILEFEVSNPKGGVSLIRLRSDLRKERFGSQERMARGLDVSVRTVSKWETGESLPTRRHLYRLAEAFGVKVTDLLVAEDTQTMVAV